MVKDLLSPEAQDAADAPFKEATDQKTKFNYTLVGLSRPTPSVRSKVTLDFEATLKQLSYYWELKINRH